MRWDLVARWTGYSAEDALIRFEAMVREGLEAVLPEQGVLAGTLFDGSSTGR
jgi:hypothetical protein